jgi:hypothetical protein
MAKETRKGCRKEEIHKIGLKGSASLTNGCRRSSKQQLEVWFAWQNA